MWQQNCSHCRQQASEWDLAPFFHMARHESCPICMGPTQKRKLWAKANLSTETVDNCGILRSAVLLVTMVVNGFLLFLVLSSENLRVQNPKGSSFAGTTWRRWRVHAQQWQNYLCFGTIFLQTVSTQISLATLWRCVSLTITVTTNTQ